MKFLFTGTEAKSDNGVSVLCDLLCTGSERYNCVTTVCLDCTRGMVAQNNVICLQKLIVDSHIRNDIVFSGED